MSFTASRTVNNGDVWWFICKRRWRGKCSVLQTGARIHLFSRVMSSKVCPIAQRPISQHCLHRDLKQLHVTSRPRLSLWNCSCVCEYGICSHKKSHEKLELVRGESCPRGVKAVHSCRQWHFNVAVFYHGNISNVLMIIFIIYSSGDGWILHSVMQSSHCPSLTTLFR